MPEKWNEAIVVNNDNNPALQNNERMFARGFTVLGGVFWIVAAFAGPFIYGGSSILGAFGFAAIPVLFTSAVLAIGWFYERVVSMILAVAAVGTMAWGAVVGWESNVWGIMLVFFIAPTVIAALLFFLAGSKARAYGAESPSEPPALP